jgi:predicted transposase/invertase (TIGR01784 family)
MQLLDPKNDYIFKRLFATAPHLLTALINAVRSDEEPLEVVEVLNPRIDPEELNGKFIVLDILAKDQHGRSINIEMQVKRFDLWSARSAYYLANMLTKQLDSGENYLDLKPVIGIHLLDFDLFTGPDQQQQAHWCFEMRDRWQSSTKLGAELELNIIELGKADRLHSAAQQSLAAWVAFFEHWSEESAMNQLTYPPVQQALERLKTLSSDTETQYRAQVRERALRDELTQMAMAERRGMEIGKLEGLQDALNKMVASGISEAQARSILGFGK